jgi:hypothetical protein
VNQWLRASFPRLIQVGTRFPPGSGATLSFMRDGPAANEEEVPALVTVPLDTTLVVRIVNDNGVVKLEFWSQPAEVGTEDLDHLGVYAPTLVTDSASPRFREPSRRGRVMACCVALAIVLTGLWLALSPPDPPTGPPPAGSARACDPLDNVNLFASISLCVPR